MPLFLLTDILAQASLHMIFGDHDHPEPGVVQYVSGIGEKPVSMASRNLPPKSDQTIRIIVVSDTHERHDKLLKLPEGDIFFHCGDVLLTSRFFSLSNSRKKLAKFNEWLRDVPCGTKIVIGGNHDDAMESLGREGVQSILTEAVYLVNDLVQIGDLRVWGTPVSTGRSRNRAFQGRKFANRSIDEAPDDVDILLTHGHCPDLERRVKHSLHLWGHAHNAYGIRQPPRILRGEPVVSLSVCAPILDKKFRPAHKPIVIDVPASANTLKRLVNDKFSAAIASIDRGQRNNSAMSDVKNVESDYTSEFNLFPAGRKKRGARSRSRGGSRASDTNGAGGARRRKKKWFPFGRGNSVVPESNA
jgi:predicted phosphodiesterase